MKITRHCVDVMTPHTGNGMKLIKLQQEKEYLRKKLLLQTLMLFLLVVMIQQYLVVTGIGVLLRAPAA